MESAIKKPSKNQLTRWSEKLICCILEFVDLPKEFIKLRLISKVFEQAAFKTLPLKWKHTRKSYLELTEFLQVFKAEDEYDLELRLIKAKNTRKALLRRVNTIQSVKEIYTYGSPPDYIHYLCEAIGECTGMIPLRASN